MTWETGVQMVAAGGLVLAAVAVMDAARRVGRLADEVARVADTLVARHGGADYDAPAYWRVIRSKERGR